MPIEDPKQLQPYRSICVSIVNDSRQRALWSTRIPWSQSYIIITQYAMPLGNLRCMKSLRLCTSQHLLLLYIQHRNFSVVLPIITFFFTKYYEYKNFCLVQSQMSTYPCFIQQFCFFFGLVSGDSKLKKSHQVTNATKILNPFILSLYIHFNFV